MEQGACGFSSGLVYEPGRYSHTAELIELAREAAPFGGVYATHMRNEGDQLLEAVDEAMTISRQAGVLNTHTRYLHENVLDYAERLLARFPPELNTAMFACTGTEANELAVRIDDAKPKLIVSASCGIEPGRRSEAPFPFPAAG